MRVSSPLDPSTDLKIHTGILQRNDLDGEVGQRLGLQIIFIYAGPTHTPSDQMSDEWTDEWISRVVDMEHGEEVQ